MTLISNYTRSFLVKAGHFKDTIQEGWGEFRKNSKGYLKDGLSYLFCSDVRKIVSLIKRLKIGNSECLQKNWKEISSKERMHHSSSQKGFLSPKLLAYYFGRKDLSKKNFLLNSFEREVKDFLVLSHFFNISGEKEVVKLNSKLIDTEGSLGKFFYQVFANICFHAKRKYAHCVPFLKSQAFQNIFQSFLFAYSEHSPEKIAERIQNLKNGDVVSVPGGWDGHAIEYTFGKTKWGASYIAISNLGQGNADTGPLYISTMDPKKVTKEFIKKLFEMMEMPYKEAQPIIYGKLQMETIDDTNPNIIPFPYIAEYFPSDQKWGNCPMARAKAGLFFKILIHSLESPEDLKNPQLLDQKAKMTKKIYDLIVNSGAGYVLENVKKRGFSSMDSKESKEVFAIADKHNAKKQKKLSETVKYFEEERVKYISKEAIHIL